MVSSFSLYDRENLILELGFLRQRVQLLDVCFKITDAYFYIKNIELLTWARALTQIVLLED